MFPMVVWEVKACVDLRPAIPRLLIHYSFAPTFPHPLDHCPCFEAFLAYLPCFHKASASSAMKWWWNGVEDSIINNVVSKILRDLLLSFLLVQLPVLIKTTFHFSCGQRTKLSYRGNSDGAVFVPLLCHLLLKRMALNQPIASWEIDTGSAAYGGIFTPFAIFRIQLSETYRNALC